MRRRSLLAAGLAGALLLGSAGIAGATADARANRLFGADRFVTARTIASNTFARSTVALLAGGQGSAWADALSASYLSGAYQAPVLLTPQNALPAGLIQTLQDMTVEGVQIVGGPTAVSDNVMRELEAAGFTVERLSGNTRYETSRKIAELLPKETVGTFGSGQAAIITTGEGYADALAASPISGSQKMPILLTGRASLHAEARAALTSLGIRQALIVGGPDAVTTAVEDQIKAMGLATQRIAGGTRAETAIRLAEVAKGELSYPMSRVLLARGDDPWDALAGGARGAQLFGPILLATSQTALGAQTRAFIKANTATIGTVDVLGGTQAISDAVANDAVAAARNQ